MNLDAGQVAVVEAGRLKEPTVEPSKARAVVTATGVMASTKQDSLDGKVLKGCNVSVRRLCVRQGDQTERQSRPKLLKEPGPFEQR